MFGNEIEEKGMFGNEIEENVFADNTGSLS